jgi:cytochrome c oxidase subunit 2
MHEAVTAPAAATSELGFLLYVALGLVFCGVMLATVVAVRSRPRPGHEMAWVVAGGLALPLVVLGAILAASLPVPPPGLPHAAPERRHDVLVHVTGWQWWWEVRYLDAAGAQVALANELHLPVGQATELVLDTGDVIHSFWVPALGGKVDMLPGRERRMLVEPRRAGVFRGQCAEFCGTQHALMSLLVVAEPPAQFREWLAAQALPAAEPANDLLARGRELFFAAGCDECHAVRGTRAVAGEGPDLTHVGSRLSLGAVRLDNGEAQLAGWIAGNQALKPGNHMPDDFALAGEELRALAAWLASLL